MHRRARRLASVHQGLKVRGIGVFGFSSNIEHDTHKRSAKSKSHAKSTPLSVPNPCVFQALQVFQAFFSPSLCLCSVVARRFRYELHNEVHYGLVKI